MVASIQATVKKRKSEQYHIIVGAFSRLRQYCARRICSQWSEDHFGVLKILLKAVRRTLTRVRPSCGWRHHHDNTQEDSSNLPQTFLTKPNVLQLRQGPYSRDIASCDCRLLPRLKMSLKEHRLNGNRRLKLIRPVQ